MFLELLQISVIRKRTVLSELLFCNLFTSHLTLVVAVLSGTSVLFCFGLYEAKADGQLIVAVGANLTLFCI